MLVKVCGMRDQENIRNVAALKPDMMGFIFYASSPRFAGNLDPDILLSLPKDICKVGVFVNASACEVKEMVERYNINVIQMHGDETPDFCGYWKKKGYKVVKALGIGTADDLKEVENYIPVCDFLLLDKKSRLYGGSGQKFDWDIIKEYKGTLPFLLSGGVAPEDILQLRRLNHPAFAGVDLNSRFEKSPGVKDIVVLKQFMNLIYSL